jgi:hypothetical protein
MNNYNVEFSKDELIALLQLIDIAIQSKGLQVAEVAVYFQGKFRETVLKVERENENKSSMIKKE